MTIKRVTKPHKLHPDKETLDRIRALGSIQATSIEIAAVLCVAEQTWTNFSKIPEVRAALEQGKGDGRASLRRTQFALAKTSAAMAIFLGKNYLGQVDKQELDHKGNLIITIPQRDIDLG